MTSKLAPAQINDMTNLREMLEDMVLQAEAAGSIQTSLRFEFVPEEDVEVGDYIPEIYLVVRKKLDELPDGTDEPTAGE